MLFHRGLRRDPRAQSETANSGRARGPLEEDLPHVVRVLHEHRARECQPALHPRLLHADNQIVHPCNHRYHTVILCSYRRIVPVRKEAVALWSCCLLQHL